jgi:hypothetical protein
MQTFLAELHGGYNPGGASGPGTATREWRMCCIDTLTQGGMSHEEAYDAVEAAEAEGRLNIGTVAEEQARAQARASAPVHVDIPAMEAGVCNVLLIQGMSISGEWMATNITGQGDVVPGLPSPDPRVLDAVQRLNLRFTPVDFHYGRENNARACVRALESGAFHAVVVCDLSDRGCIPSFQASLGTPLRNFATAGGRVAFPTSEGHFVAPVLREIFGVQWEHGDYGGVRIQRTSGNDALIDAFFPAAGVTSFYEKVLSYKNVPADENMFSNTKGQAGVAVKKIGDAGGLVAYFGDHNCQPDTVLLLLAYASAAPQTADAWFHAAVASKEAGNRAFRNRRFADAARHYRSAAGAFHGRDDTSEAQRATLVVIYSNMAEAFLRLSNWTQARAYATHALEIDGTHVKSLLRRAKALKGARLHDLAADDLHAFSTLKGAPPTAAFYPNGSSYGLVAIGAKRTAFTHDVGAACYEMRHFIDRAFLESLPSRPQATRYGWDAIDVRSLSPCLPTIRGPIVFCSDDTLPVGMLEEPLHLTVIAGGAVEGLNLPLGTFESTFEAVDIKLANVVVVNNLPVPLHISVGQFMNHQETLVKCGAGAQPALGAFIQRHCIFCSAMFLKKELFAQRYHRNDFWDPSAARLGMTDNMAQQRDALKECLIACGKRNEILRGWATWDDASSNCVSSSAASIPKSSPWPTDRVVDLARQRGWEPLPSTDPSLLRFIRGSSVAASHELIHVWPTTGTVGSYLEHPSQGRTQLFRRKLTFRDLEAIFANPRTHTGSGYHRREQMPRPSASSAGAASAAAPPGRRVCSMCRREHPKSDFSKTQWSKRNRSPGTMKCKQCCVK